MNLNKGYPKIKCDPSRFEAHVGNKCKVCREAITPIGLRLKRWGHINLAAPIAHTWFLNDKPSYISAVLDMPLQDLKKVIYFDKYIVVESKILEIKVKKLFTENQYRKAIKDFGKDQFVVKIGAEALKYLLKKVDVEELYNELRKEMGSQSFSEDSRSRTRLKVIEGLLLSESRPEDMILEDIPVFPPDLRVIALDRQDKIVGHPINNFYRNVINRNKRLLKFFELNVPEIIIQNEKKMLQEAVDKLFYLKLHKKSHITQIGSMSESLTYIIDDQPYCKFGLCQLPASFKNSKIPRAKTLIKDVLNTAKKIREYGNDHSLNDNKKDIDILYNLLFVSLLHKLRGLCLDVKHEDKLNNVSESALRITSFVEEEKYDSKYKELKQALEKDPNDADAYWARGELYLERKLFNSAVLDFTKVIELNPTRAEAYYKRGLSYVGPEDNSPEAHLLRAIYGIKTKSQNDWETSVYPDRYYDGALLDFTKAIELNSTYTEAFYERAKIYEKQHKHDEALADLIKLIEIDPNHLEACKKLEEIKRNLLAKKL